MAVESSAVGAGAAAGTSGGQRLKAGQLSLPNCVALSAAVMAPVIAVILNARGVKTARGGAWYDSTVRNLLQRKLEDAA